MEFKHKPVLLEECINGLNIKPNGIYVDGTLGGAGHSRVILEHLSSEGMLIGIDRDEDALKAAKEKLKDYTNVKYIHGNHDDIDMWKSVISDSGFIDIRDNYDLIYMNDVKPILISGLDQDSDKVNKFLENDNVYSIVIMHEPDKALNVSGYNLMLGGHSHNGQIRLPYIGALYKIEGSKTYYDEHYKIKGNDLFISGGLGCSLLNLRFFNHPSINFYRIVNK